MRASNALDYLQSILDTVRDPMLVLDSDLRVRTASRAFREAFHVSASETEGRLVYELGNGQWDIPALRTLLETILPAQTVFEAFEVVHAFPIIGQRTMLLNGRKIWRETNHTELILLHIEDITERKAAEERLEAVLVKLQRTSGELKRSNDDLEQFARVAGHDLKAPLSTIVRFSQLLERCWGTSSPEESREFLQHIVANGRRMSMLIDDLLKYAVVTQGGQDPPAQPIRANDACLLATEALAEAIESNAAEVHCAITADVIVSIEISRLVQVFQNLIGNAIHYRRPHVPPQVEVSAIRQDSLWKFAVHDNGQGIPHQYLKEVFTPFRRLHGYEKPGSGIGLSTCQRIIERADGTIWVDSVPGEGSTFYFLLPNSV